MSTLALRCQRNARMLLEVASTECEEMHSDMHEDAMYPDKETIYSASEEMRRFGERMNDIADQLMTIYNKMDHHQYMIELDDLRSESYAQ